MIPSKIKIKNFAKRYHMGTLGGKGLTHTSIYYFFIIIIIKRDLISVLSNY